MMKTKTRYLLYILGFSWLWIYVLFFPPKFYVTDYTLRDLVLKWFPNARQEKSEDVVVIDIDTKSLLHYGTQYPINRKLLSLLLARLSPAKMVVLTLPVQGASGTSGDVALYKVVRRQTNIVLPVRFSELGSNLDGIVNAESLVWLPWKKILPFVSVGAVDFYLSPTGKVEGFYPFFSYRGKIVPHVLMKLLAVDKGFDENAFSFSPRWNYLSWQTKDGEFRLGLDYNRGVSLAPTLQRNLPSVKIFSLEEVLPVKLYKKYARHGIRIPPLESVKDKMCIVGYNEGPRGAFLPVGGSASYPLHHIVAVGFEGLREGNYLKVIPIWLQSLMVFLLAVGSAWIATVRPGYGVLVGMGVVVIELFLFSWLLLRYQVFGLVSEWVVGSIGILTLGVLFGYRKKYLERRVEEIEKTVVKEIKEKTTFIPSHRDWMDVRIREVAGEEVGGGVYDFIEINADKVGLAVGDVMDKGKSALTKISYLRGLLRSHSIITHQPGEVVYSINKALVKASVLNMSCRFLYVLFDGSRNRIVFSGAGGVSFILLDRHRKQLKCYEVEERIPLGLSREIFYEPKEITIQKGDVLIFYTPSLFNLKNSEGRSYDVDRLGKVILSNARLSLAGLLDRISADVKRFAPVKEDFALIAVEWKKEPLSEDDQDIFVGISPSERELLLFYKKVNRSRRLPRE